MRIVRDTLLIFRRQMLLSVRNPAWVIIGVIQPVLYLALFGPLLTRLPGMPGFPPGNAWQIFVPGLLVQLGLFGAAFVGFSIIAELRWGVVERLRVTPASRLALLLGRVLRDVVTLVVQCVILVLAGLAFGLRAPVGGVVLALVIVALLAIGISALSYAVGLIFKSEDVMAPLLNAVVVPLMLLSGILLPLTIGPAWLNDLSRINPFRYVVNALRDAFLGRYATTVMWEGIGVAAGLAVVCVAFGTRTFRRENA